MQLHLGETYARKYRIVRVLGEGAMGAVYEAENVMIRRRVAIKVLHAHIAQKADTLLRFEREAQAAGRIGSAHIVEVLDLGELSDGDRFMVMEFLEGTTLDRRIRGRGRLSPEEATPIITQLLEGLGAAHRAEIIHRDLKPANVFLLSGRGPTDFVKILDFGVSKFNVLNDEMSMTSTGAVLGTPYYMSPEQAKGSRQIDPRSDLYAVGVILYECITGQVPFSAETFNELIFRIVLESPPPVESYVPNLDPAFAALIHKAMSREAGERYQTAAEFQEALTKWLAQADVGPMMPPLRAPGGRGPVGPVLAGNGTLMMDQAPSVPDAPDFDIDNARTLTYEPPRGSPGAMQGVPPPWMALPPPVVPAMPDHFPFGPPAEPLPAAAPGVPAALTPTAPPPSMQVTFVTPKRAGGILAFSVGLIGVLILGGGTVAAMKWSASREAAAAAAAANAGASAAIAAKPAAMPSLPVPTPVPSLPMPAPSSAAGPEPSALPAAPATTPVAITPPPEQVAAGRSPPVQVGRPAAPKGTAAPKSTAAPTTTAIPGKRTISTEL